jgi:CDP-diacylglycerol--glycerol-3-phosphate 3-phosphatidyltransferase
MKLTTASKITIVRVLLIPVVLILMYSDFSGHMFWAIAAFIIASVSDFLDGYIARRYNQVSNFGKFLDPLADKMLVISVMIVFVDWSLMPAWVAIIVIVRELAVTGLRLVAVEGGKVIAAAWSGKIKTASTMVCFVLMMLSLPVWLNTVCWAVILATTVYSGIEYFVKNLAVFKS